MFELIKDICLQYKTGKAVLKKGSIVKSDKKLGVGIAYAVVAKDFQYEIKDGVLITEGKFTEKTEEVITDEAVETPKEVGKEVETPKTTKKGK